MEVNILRFFCLCLFIPCGVYIKKELLFRHNFLFYVMSYTYLTTTLVVPIITTLRLSALPSAVLLVALGLEDP